jgi:hypothetical protein
MKRVGYCDCKLLHVRKKIGGKTVVRVEWQKIAIFNVSSGRYSHG